MGKKTEKWDGDYVKQHKKDKRITMEVRRQGVQGEKALFLTELQMETNQPWSCNVSNFRAASKLSICLGQKDSLRSNRVYTHAPLKMLRNTLRAGYNTNSLRLKHQYHSFEPFSFGLVTNLSLHRFLSGNTEKYTDLSYGWAAGVTINAHWGERLVMHSCDQWKMVQKQMFALSVPCSDDITIRSYVPLMFMYF